MSDVLSFKGYLTQQHIAALMRLRQDHSPEAKQAYERSAARMRRFLGLYRSPVARRVS